MPIHLRNLQTIPVPRRGLRRVAARALRRLDAAGAELSVALVDDARMRALNRQYRRLDRSTDVLAFPQQEPWAGPAVTTQAGRRQAPPLLLGDVVLSVETITRQAGRSPQAVPREMTFVLLHGILHLMGWDHRTPAQRRRMRRQERVLWKAAWSSGDFGEASATRWRG